MRSEKIKNKIYITRHDMERLEIILDAVLLRNNNQDENIKKLMDDLDRADIIDGDNIPDDVVIMNSQVYIMDLDSHEEMTFKLVFPEEANLDDKKVSVLAPVGSAVLGYRTGDTVEWNVPSRKRRLKIGKVVHWSG